MDIMIKNTRINIKILNELELCSSLVWNRSTGLLFHTRLDSSSLLLDKPSIFREEILVLELEKFWITTSMKHFLLYIFPENIHSDLPDSKIQSKLMDACRF